MKFARASSETVKEAAKIIRQGGLVAFPTETVYGLGANALDPLAVARIFDAKERPHFDPIIVHVDSPEMAWTLVTEVEEKVRLLANKFWPGPLTLVLPKQELVPDIVTAGLSTVAIRLPSHPIARKLIKAAGVPIAAPSANKFGFLSPTTAFHVKDQLNDRVDFILDGGPCPIGVESTIVKLSDPPVLLRPGGLPLEDIESVIGSLTSQTEAITRPEAPGQLKTHYSPRKPLYFVDTFPGQIQAQRIAYLAFQNPPHEFDVHTLEVLSPSGNLTEAAANLFAALHRLDQAEVDIILVERVPEAGLGRAIMNRLERATTK